MKKADYVKLVKEKENDLKGMIQVTKSRVEAVEHELTYERTRIKVYQETIDKLLQCIREIKKTDY